MRLISSLWLVGLSSALVLPEIPYSMRSLPLKTMSVYNPWSGNSSIRAFPSLTAAGNVNHTLLSRAPQLDEPELPHGPTWWGFPDQDHINAAATALLDCWQLAIAARVELALQSCGPTRTYQRYFKDEDLETVRKAFMLVSGEDFQGPDVMEEALQIRWRFDSVHPDSKCDQLPLKNGYFDQEEIHGVYSADLVLCDVVFNRVTSNSLEEELANGCNMITDRATPSMDIPAGTVLHELLHWKELTVKNDLDPIVDWNYPDIIPNVDPPTGYGAYNAKRLNDLDKKSYLNADNYVYFALESFFLRHCENLIDAHGDRRESFEDPTEVDWVYAIVPC